MCCRFVYKLINLYHLSQRKCRPCRTIRFCRVFSRAPVHPPATPLDQWRRLRGVKFCRELHLVKQVKGVKGIFRDGPYERSKEHGVFEAPLHRPVFLYLHSLTLQLCCFASATLALDSAFSSDIRAKILRMRLVNVYGQHIKGGNEIYAWLWKHRINNLHCWHQRN